ncbi:MAG: hypothetical protein ACE5DS_09790 [Kiloniellaceae bacterium]
MSAADDVLRRARQRNPLHGLDAEQRAAIEAHYKAQRANLKSQLSATKGELRHMEKDIGERDQRIALMEQFRELPHTVPPIRSAKKLRKEASTPVFVASDWHIEESVDPRAVGGLNAYDLDIAWARARSFFDSVCWCIKDRRHGAKIDDVVVALLGDFITGIVPKKDLSMRREVGPAKAARIAKEMLTEGLEKIATVAGARRIVVPCVPGNHGRMTDAPASSRSAQWNIEWFMLGELADHFRNRKQFEFVVPEDFCVLLDIQGARVRFHHGDAVRFAGGVGGLTIPLNKARWRWNETPGGQADLDVLGHFHQAFDGGSFIVNGSLIGVSGYARKSFSYQPPEQMGFLVRPEKKGAPVGSRGKTESFRVFVA